MERMCRVHERLAQHTYPNTRELAAELAVSRKTLARDMEYMMDHFQLPIAYNPQKHGYYYNAPVQGFPAKPAVSLSESEMFWLLIAHKVIRQYHGTALQQPAEVAFRKITTCLDGAQRYSLESLEGVLSFQPFVPGETDLRQFETLGRAIREGRTIEFDYRKPGHQQKERRRVRPYHLRHAENGWYLVGHDNERREVRTFALARLSRLAATGERFVRPESFDPDRYFGNAFSVLNGDGDHQVVLKFDKWATDILRGRKWHPTQTVEELSDGGCRLSIRVGAVEEVARWVCSWGEHVRVVAPRALSEQVTKVAQGLLRNHPPPSTALNP